MTHRFCVLPEQLSRDLVRFSRDQAHQIGHVLRLRAGDHVRVFDGVVMEDRLVELEGAEGGRVVGQCPQAAEPRTRVTVYPALLQRDKFESVLQKLTEIGAAAIAPVLTTRGLVREPPDARRLTRWQTIVREATEQCGRGRVPELLPTLPFGAAVGSAADTTIVAYESEHSLQLRDSLANSPKNLSLFIGPEGGFTPEEITSARESGARVVTLGPRVLRAETASPMLLALVLYALDDLSWPAMSHAD
jgi:16S rRNA (uracil1498-N3)-methyltransferase